MTFHHEQQDSDARTHTEQGAVHPLTAGTEPSDVGDATTAALPEATEWSKTNSAPDRAMRAPDTVIDSVKALEEANPLSKIPFLSLLIAGMPSRTNPNGTNVIALTPSGRGKTQMFIELKGLIDDLYKNNAHDQLLCYPFADVVIIPSGIQDISEVFGLEYVVNDTSGSQESETVRTFIAPTDVWWEALRRYKMTRKPVLVVLDGFNTYDTRVWHQLKPSLASGNILLNLEAGEEELPAVFVALGNYESRITIPQALLDRFTLLTDRAIADTTRSIPLEPSAELIRSPLVVEMMMRAMAEEHGITPPTEPGFYTRALAKFYSLDGYGGYTPFTFVQSMFKLHTATLDALPSVNDSEFWSQLRESCTEYIKDLLEESNLSVDEALAQEYVARQVEGMRARHHNYQIFLQAYADMVGASLTYQDGVPVLNYNSDSPLHRAANAYWDVRARSDSSELTEVGESSEDSPRRSSARALHCAAGFIATIMYIMPAHLMEPGGLAREAIENELMHPGTIRRLREIAAQYGLSELDISEYVNAVKGVLDRLHRQMTMEATVASTEAQ